MTTLWDVLIPPKHSRTLRGLSSMIAQLGGHARSVEYFIAFLLGPGTRGRRRRGKTVGEHLRGREREDEEEEEEEEEE